MKELFKIKFLLLVAILATAFLCSGNTQACNSVMHYASTISNNHIGLAFSAVAIVPLTQFVKDNSTISPTQLADLVTKHGKIKLLTVVLEPPVYDAEGNITDNGEFYSFAVKRPDPGVVKMMMGYAKAGKTDEYVEAFIKNLIVGGDLDALKSNGLVYLGLASQVDVFLKPYESFLEKA